ncbi:TetR/AcrR family transcriptional regulator [Litorihabitans aurantiacus]|uniref:TetR family transcriptional regulator n=1 Tax=Litorihabitans aurantiacus TaxID=1930061 RepID=A0AA37XEA2_9MICO|nr:TetR/AcrR family transcriptional regulator [Litorihabitans aurantiacus]GMA31666.1 TetR family transcriptional regulator [Litorihabitans aurantiacus]
MSRTTESSPPTAASTIAPSPRERRAAERRRRILDLAVELAETEGWPAVTTRRLAAAIDYTQPVIYQHFASRDALVAAVVADGFADLGARVIEAAGSGEERLLAACRAYVEFGAERPRLYEAMFTAEVPVAFDAPDTPAPVRGAFDVLRDIVESERPDADATVTAELLWACCHGLVSLRASGRIAAERVADHLGRLVAAPAEAPPRSGPHSGV